MVRVRRFNRRISFLLAVQVELRNPRILHSAVPWGAAADPKTDHVGIERRAYRNYNAEMKSGVPDFRIKSKAIVVPSSPISDPYPTACIASNTFKITLYVD